MSKKYCPNCGEGVESEVKYCPACGLHLDDTPAYKPASRLDILSLIGFILSFLQPIAGLIISIIASKKTNLCPRDKAFTKAGIIISAVRLAIDIIGYILLAIFYQDIVNLIYEYLSNFGYIIVD